MLVIGDKRKLAFEIDTSGQVGDLRTVNIYIANKNISFYEQQCLCSTVH